jgi:hypothetical protein
LSAAGPLPSGCRLASLLQEVSVMFKWLQSRRHRREVHPVAEPRDDDRDSGEEEYESHEEEEHEVAPDGMTRMKTDNI